MAPLSITRLKPRILAVIPDFSLTLIFLIQIRVQIQIQMCLLHASLIHFVSTYWSHDVIVQVDLLFRMDYSPNLVIILPANSLALLEFVLHPVSRFFLTCRWVSVPSLFQLLIPFTAPKFKFRGLGVCPMSCNIGSHFHGSLSHGHSPA